MEKEEDSVILWIFLLAMGLVLGFMFTLTLLPILNSDDNVPQMQPIYELICKNIEGHYNCDYSRIAFGISSIVFFVFSAIMGLERFKSPIGMVVFFVGWIGGFVSVAMMI